MNYYGKYHRGCPDSYLMFLTLFQQNDPAKVGLFVCIDNDDHAVSKEFYEFRKIIKTLNRKGFDVKVFINPRFKDQTNLEDWVKNQLPGHDVFLKYQEGPSQ